jgi:putative chitinase
MQPLTKAELEKFAPGALPEYVDALVNGWSTMTKHGITANPLRLCNFLAQIAHETGGFTIFRENTNWSVKRMGEIWPARFDKLKNPVGYAKCVACGNDEVKKANLAYSGRTDVGNKGGSDGWDYRGNGPLQDTGRFAFAEAGRILGEDLENNPDNYNIYKGFRVACHKWEAYGLNRLADRHYIRAIGNRINRGNSYSAHEPIGHADRLRWFDRAWQFFGDGPLSVPDGMALGAHGETVKTLQAKLRELGYPVGKIDGVFGTSLARAVAAFKLDHKRENARDLTELEPDEIVGIYTTAALDTAKPAEINPERKEATEKEIVAASDTAKAGKEVEVAGTAMVMAGALGGGTQQGLFDGMSASFDWLPGVQSVLTPVASAAQWGFKNAFWVVPLLFGFWFWKKGRHVVMARAKDYWSGFNLSK